MFKNPNELKEKNKIELEKIAEEIRDFLVTSVSKTGGHLGSNLGIVELTLAMHIVFDSPRDKFIFDVGHQGYVHKILTGRASQFDTLRQHNGLSGFLKLNESEHDVWEAGHSSTSISAATGFACARDLNNEDHDVIAVIGDGSLTNGMAMEALNHISELDTKVIIILNDNGMSISKNVGFIDEMLKGMQKKNSYYRTKGKVHDLLETVPGGSKIDNLLAGTKNVIKNQINGPKNYFNMMGLNYLGPVDGHDFNSLFENLSLAKKQNSSVIIHVKTEKGRGYEPARLNKWHGIGPFDIESGISAKNKQVMTYSRLISNHLDTLMQKDQDIVVITPAMLGGSELDELAEKYPTRVTDVGIAEEHACTFAGGLALGGKRPFVSIYSTFLQRAYDQVFHDLIRQKLDVVIGIDRAGLVGDDGETHQGIYDISFLSHMPGIIIMMGSTPNETTNLLSSSFNYPGVKAIRYPRAGNISVDYQHIHEDIEFGTWTKSKDASKYIISYGPDITTLIDLTKDLDIGVINARFIKPLDTKMLDLICDKPLYVVEEHANLGGLATMILEYYNETKTHVNLTKYNLGDEFVEQGKVELLKAEAKIMPEQVIARILDEN